MISEQLARSSLDKLAEKNPQSWLDIKSCNRIQEEINSKWHK
jgi:hypothetical protein